MKRNCGTCSYLKPEAPQGAYCGYKANCYGMWKPSGWVPVGCLRVIEEEPV